MKYFLRTLLLGIAAVLCMATSMPRWEYEVVSVSPDQNAGGVAGDVKPELVLRLKSEGKRHAPIAAEDLDLVALPSYTPVRAQVTTPTTTNGTVRFVFSPEQPLAPGDYELRHDLNSGQRIDWDRTLRSEQPGNHYFDLVVRFTVGAPAARP